MTREEVTNVLKKLQVMYRVNTYVVESIDMAIKALKGGDAEMNEAKSPYMQQSPNGATHGRLIDADFEEQHYASMLLNPTPDVTAKDRENAKIILGALKMAKTVSAGRPSKVDKDGMNTEQAKKYCKECQHNEVCRYYPYDGCQFKDTDRPHGEWVKSKIPNELYVCSNCGGACWSYDYERTIVKSNFCPNCGADMNGYDRRRAELKKLKEGKK